MLITLNTKGSLCFYQFFIYEFSQRGYASLQTPKQERTIKDHESLLLKLISQTYSENTILCYEISIKEINKIINNKNKQLEIKEILFCNISKLNEIVLLVSTNSYGPMLFILKVMQDSINISRWFSPFSNFEISTNEEIINSIVFKDMVCIKDWFLLLRSDESIGIKIFFFLVFSLIKMLTN